MKTRPSARDRLREFFSSNVGAVLRTQELRDVAGISDYARRIRELRDEEGMAIKTFKERADLRPDEYILENLAFMPVANTSIPESLRKMALERDGVRCRFCGADPSVSAVQGTSSRSRLKLRIDYMEPPEEGGAAELENIGVMCFPCAKRKNKGRKAGQSARELVLLIRRAAPGVQREVYAILKRSFEGRSDER
jgi:hypothetical protein